MEHNLDKRNFLNWYLLYATQGEIEKAKQTNKVTLDRLTNEYSYEIDEIRKTKRFYDSLSLPKGVLPDFQSFGCI